MAGILVPSRGSSAFSGGPESTQKSKTSTPAYGFYFRYWSSLHTPRLSREYTTSIPRPGDMAGFVSAGFTQQLKLHSGLHPCSAHPGVWSSVTSHLWKTGGRSCWPEGLGFQERLEKNCLRCDVRVYGAPKCAISAINSARKSQGRL
jgi:hypothetical protein